MTLPVSECGGRPAGKSRWLLRPPSPAFGARLFCFPYSGCGATMYRRWPANIGPVEICPLQLPGRENRTREPHYGTYEQLADSLSPALLPYLDRPYGFFGHCGGVLPGFETAIRLVEHGCRPPAHFFVSAEVAPHDGPFGRFLWMPPGELRGEIRQLSTAVSGVEPLPEMVDFLLEVLMADLEANRRYRKSAPVALPCPITVFHWDQDPDVKLDLMSGWRDCGSTRFQTLKGGHYQFLDAPEALLNEIRQDLEAALDIAGDTPG